MDETRGGIASFWTQADALLRKSLTYQKRNVKTNVRLIAFPFVLCVLLAVAQTLIDSIVAQQDVGGTGETLKPPPTPPLLLVPAPQFRSVGVNESCRATGSCPVTILFTGMNQTLGTILARNLFPRSFTMNVSDLSYSLANAALGSSVRRATLPIDPALDGKIPLYSVQKECLANSSFTIPFQLEVMTPKETRCVQHLNIWHNSSSVINDELFRGFSRGNPEGRTNEILGGYDFLNSNTSNFNVSIWFNATRRNLPGTGEKYPMRVTRSVNLISNAYLELLRGPNTKVLFEFVKEMPNVEIKINVEMSSIIGSLFYTWVVLQLFPVVLTSLVYEKQQRLRIMMKMHGLGDGPYWLITYAYFLVVSSLYMVVLVAFGSVIGLKFFSQNDYTVQFVFYFIYINLQISWAFLVATWFTNVKTATVVCYICVFATGLLGQFLFEPFVEDFSFPKGWIIVMQLFPGFALYRGLYEFGQYTLVGTSMRWKNLGDSMNGLKDVLIIMTIEWIMVLCVAYYMDQVVSTGSGKNPLFILQKFRKKTTHQQSSRMPNFQRQGSKAFVNMDKPDVCQEREKVQQLLLEPMTNHAIVVDNIRKVYPGRDGNPSKLAVSGLSLALPRAECFGMLGPNGAGKTSFISMTIGLTKPSSGTAFIQGYDLRTQMDYVYTCMGVCPQHDLLWDTLTGREHLLFYGRLKNLKGKMLTQAVEESLKSVGLFNGGVGDKQSGTYSGGMKRRLSVAISLIGDPKVVYLDEPSTGLDPASRSHLWNVVKRAKQDRAIILTTHSMEEAEALCDRLGIFVDGGLQCIGNAKELKARYGGCYVFTMTTSEHHEQEVENMVRRLSPGAKRTYHISGTQKFEMPKHEVKISDVFHAVDTAKTSFPVIAWGLSDATLEDVFIKVANDA